jgi:peptide/nickel transport system substrate-binding protein
MTRGRTAIAAIAALALTAAATAWPATGRAQDYQEVPMVSDAVEAGELPPVAERLPDAPRVLDFEGYGLEIGRSGGEITWLARRARDIRIMNVYGYARLVGYDRDFELEPDILESIEVEGERIFTLHLRPGLRWSDGEPFTADDFAYFWNDVNLNEDLRPYGPDVRLTVDGQLPDFEVIDEYTVRYTWQQPNPEFLPALAGAAPLYIYLPEHYMRQFHADYADAEALEQAVEESGERNWVALHIRRGDLYEANNPDLPVLQPWVNTTPPPSDRFVFERNPFFHRVDPEGMQLPYLDRVIVRISDSSLIPAQTGAGESDLQARSLRFDNITFLLEGEERNDYTVHLWSTALGSEVALYPNLNVTDNTMRELNRDVRFRRALSMAINRDEINQVIFFGLASPGNNTALPASPLYDEERTQLYATYQPDAANALLDEMGLTERNAEGIRLLPSGEPLEIVVHTAGERTMEVDVLELIADTWRDVGVAMFTSSSQRDVFRTRIYAGEVAMSVWYGFDNALFTASTVPRELAPVEQAWLQYPKWGQYVQTGGDAGEPPDMDFGIRLMELWNSWMTTTDRLERMAVVEEMLDIHAEQVTSIGTVQGVLQPVVVANRLHNVPEEGVYSWNPGAHFGVYNPDAFWVDE